MAGSFPKKRVRTRKVRLTAGMGWLLLGSGLIAAPGDSIEAVHAKYSEIFSRLPPPVHQFEGTTEAEAAKRTQQNRQFRQLRREEGLWFAALVSLEPSDALAIK